MQDTADVGNQGSMERPIDRLLAQYAVAHRHPTNERIHMVCVPAIVWSVLGVLWSVHPLLAIAVSAAAQIYYLRLSLPFAVGMLLMSAVFLLILAVLPPAIVLPLSGAVFVVAWIGQFIGHKIEGMKPSFFQDLRAFVIAPLFILGFLYRRIHVAY